MRKNKPNQPLSKLTNFERASNSKPKADRKAKVYFEEDGRLEAVKEETVSVIGYGNQGRSQALNMRDQGLEVLIGCREDEYALSSRGVRYVTLPLPRKFRRSFREIVSGSFAREWETKRATLKLRILKKFASRQKIGKIEERVRKILRINEEES